MPVRMPASVWQCRPWLRRNTMPLTPGSSVIMPKPSHCLLSWLMQGNWWRGCSGAEHEGAAVREQLNINVEVYKINSRNGAFVHASDHCEKQRGLWPTAFSQGAGEFAQGQLGILGARQAASQIPPQRTLVSAKAMYSRRTATANPIPMGLAHCQGVRSTSPEWWCSHG